MRKILLVIMLLSTSVQFLQAQSNLEIHHKNKDIRFLEDENIQNEFYKLEKESFSSKSAEFGDAPDWFWTSKFGGSGNDNVKGLISDSEGNVYIAGSFSGKTTIETTTLISKGEREALIAKFDNLGNLVWIKNIPTENKWHLMAARVPISACWNYNLTVNSRLN